MFIETGGPGGAERVVVQLARGLQSRGVDVLVASLRTGWMTDNLIRHSVPYRQLPSSRKFDITLPFRLARLFKSERCDVLLTHLLDSNFYGALASRLGAFPHLAVEHGDVHHIEGKKFSQFKLRISALLRTRFIAVSDYTSRQLTSLGISPSRITVIRNPLPSFPPLLPDERSRLRARLRASLCTENSWLWIHVANIRPVKDQETLIKGFAHALTIAPAQVLCIIGDGPQRASLQMLAESLGIERKVHFLGFRDDVGSWLQASDGFVLTSLSEAMPMSVLEAVSTALYIVSSNVGGMSEIIGSGCGSLFERGNAPELGQRLAEVVSVPEVSKRIAMETREKLFSICGDSIVVARYEDLLSSVAGADTPSS